ncbi:MAG: C4-dicarboxylate ABC transporter [Burkholderiales bacterium]|nr:C4-dicarboxylate ABC transporter [Burkholderiales bacterium]
MSNQKTPLKHLSPGWFSAVMGWAGLALAWLRAGPLMGDMAGALALVAGAVATLGFLLLAGASVMRLQRYPEAVQADLTHPVRYGFVATFPAALILLASLAVALGGPELWSETLWWAGCTLQLVVTLWVLGRVWLGHQAGGLQWPGVTPLLIVPAVGNVLAPLAGVSLGHGDFAAAQFGIGLFLWPLVTALLLVRVANVGLWPERMLPASFVLVAPPAVIGLSAMQLGAPVLLGWMCWGIAVFTLLWVGRLLRRVAAAPFGLAHWSMSFPLAALSGLTLTLAANGGLLKVLGPAVLALTSLVILALTLATWRGLRAGTLLAPETVAVITKEAAPGQA